MRKILISIIGIMLLISFNIPYGLADEDYFTLEHYTDPTTVASVGGEVTLTVKISHDYNSAYVMSGAAIYKGDTKIITFGDVYAGQEVTKSGNLAVSSSETSGVTLTLKYKENGQTQISKNFKVEFSEVQQVEPDVTFTRTLSKTSGESSDSVTLKYEVKNTGSVHINNVVISDSAIGSIKTLAMLKTGQHTNATYSATINNGFISIPKLTYTVGGKSYEQVLSGVEVTAGAPSLELELVANKTIVAPEEEVVISCTVTNTGTASLNTVIISESNNGELFNIEGLDAGESKTYSKEFVILETGSLSFTAAGDNGGEQEWTDNQVVEIKVDPLQAPLNATIDATVSTTVLEFPGVVNFDITVENIGTETLTGMKITDRDSNVIETITQQVPGKNSFQWSTNVESTGTYFFTLIVPVEDGLEQKVSTTPIEIIVQSTDTENEVKGEVQPTGVFTEADLTDDGSTSFFGLKSLRTQIIIIGLLTLAVILIIIRLFGRRRY